MNTIEVIKEQLRDVEEMVRIRVDLFSPSDEMCVFLNDAMGEFVKARNAQDPSEMKELIRDVEGMIRNMRDLFSASDDEMRPFLSDALNEIRDIRADLEQYLVCSPCQPALGTCVQRPFGHCTRSVSCRGLMKAIGYVRVSTEGQAQDGISLDAQQAKISAWCQISGYESIGMFVDAGLSGSRSDNRPALQEALAQACKHKAALVVYSLSRLARSTKDAILISEHLDKNGADLVSLSERIDTTTAAGKMVFRMLAVLAEFQRDQVAERTKGALGHLRLQGKRISGQIPYGYDLAADGETLSVNVLEQEGLRLITTLRLEGLGRRRIADRLNKEGIPSKTGAPWSHQTVGGIIKRTITDTKVYHECFDTTRTRGLS
jgi:DNA invertase Pin-like site-specific DNA recombinase